MKRETIQPGEPDLLVFVSSRQDAEMNPARAIAFDTVDNYPGMRCWAFENAPASSEQARKRYLRNAGQADFVIWLIGSTTTRPVVEEIEACMDAGGSLLAFMFPAESRDSDTEELINKASQYATWRRVNDIHNLPVHINTALTDEINRRLRDPSPVNHNLFLGRRLQESIAETKRLWTSLGVPDSVATELANDLSIGHKLVRELKGFQTVFASQGSGKTLAAQRLYQHSIRERLVDHTQPFPVFLRAREIEGNLNRLIENAAQGQASQYTERVKLIVDGLDEMGRYDGNQVLDQMASYIEANNNVAAVVMTRPLPGLNPVGESTALAECNEEEFLSVASRIAGRRVKPHEIPYRESNTRLPLFAVILGAYLRNSARLTSVTPSQMVNHLVHRLLEQSREPEQETMNLLQRLAVEAVNSGESVEKSTISPRRTDHVRITESRLVEEEANRFDFTLAIFREWFASRALVEGVVGLEQLGQISDRWTTPIAIAINSENPAIGQTVMEFLSSTDPGLGGIVLEEVKHNWSAEDRSAVLPPESAMEIGTKIRRAMINWREGLGPLMTYIGPQSQDSDMPSIAIHKGDGIVTTAWYIGNGNQQPVVQIPEKLNSTTDFDRLAWNPWRESGIEHTPVWPWVTSKYELSEALADLMQTMRLSLESQDVVDELAFGFYVIFSKLVWRQSTTPRNSDAIEAIDNWMANVGIQDEGTLQIGRYTFLFTELNLIRTKLLELSLAGRKNLSVTLGPVPINPGLRVPQAFHGMNCSQTKDCSKGQRRSLKELYESTTVSWNDGFPTSTDGTN